MGSVKIMGVRSACGIRSSRYTYLGGPVFPAPYSCDGSLDICIHGRHSVSFQTSFIPMLANVADV